MYKLNYFDFNTGDTLERRRHSLRSNEEFRQHIEELLRSPITIPGFFGSVSGTLLGPHLIVKIFDSGNLISSFVVATRNDIFSHREFGLLAESVSGTEVEEPLAPYCASYRPKFSSLANCDWVPDYERCVAWQWLEMLTTAAINLSSDFVKV